MIPAFIPSAAPLKTRTSLRIAQHRRPASARAQTSRMQLQVGQRVRVAVSITMFHCPGKFNRAIDVQGMEGTVVNDVSMRDGVAMTPLAPYVVQFDDNSKFKAHFEESELQVI